MRSKVKVLSFLSQHGAVNEGLSFRDARTRYEGRVALRCYTYPADLSREHARASVLDTIQMFVRIKSENAIGS